MSKRNNMLNLITDAMSKRQLKGWLGVELSPIVAKYFDTVFKMNVEQFEN